MISTTRDQQRGINQRHEQLLAECHGQPLESDVARQHFVNVSALLARHQRGGVDLWDDTLGGEGVGEQLSAFDAITDVLENLPSCGSFCRLISSSSEFRMGKPARIRVRNCWLKTRNVLCFSFRLRRSDDARGQHALGLNPVDQIALLREAVAHFGFGISLLDVLLHAPAIVRDFDYKFRHRKISATFCSLLLLKTDG